MKITVAIDDKVLLDDPLSSVRKVIDYYNNSVEKLCKHNKTDVQNITYIAVI